MASRLLGSFPRASSITTETCNSATNSHSGGSCSWKSKTCANSHCASLYITRAMWHKTRKLSTEYCILTSLPNNLNHHFRSVEIGSKCDKCERKYFMNATSTESHEPEPLAPISKRILMSIKDGMDLTCKLARPYVTIAMVIGILSTSLLAVENLSDLSPAFFIGLFQYIAASLCMLVYHAASNELADVEIDKINKPHHPLVSGQYSTRTAVIVASSFLFMSVSIGWLVGSWPLIWGNLATFVLATAYAVNLPFLRWKRFTSLTLVYTIAGPMLSTYLAPFLHIKTHVLKRTAIYPRSLIFSLVINGVYYAVVGLAKDIPDIEGDKAGGIQTLAIRLGPERVFWFCVSLLEMAYGVAILVGATFPSLWSKIVMVSAHAIMALVLWCNTKSIDLKSKAAVQCFFMIIFKLICAESVVIALAR